MRFAVCVPVGLEMTPEVRIRVGVMVPVTVVLGIGELVAVRNARRWVAKSRQATGIFSTGSSSSVWQPRIAESIVLGRFKASTDWPRQ